MKGIGRVGAASIYCGALGLLALGLAGAAAKEDIAKATLDVHNTARAKVGVAPLVWSDKLASDAGVWADRLAKMDHLEHSTTAERPGQGENLAGATKGSRTAVYLAGLWIAEQKSYRDGVFPDVSTTGKWADVGHYTQAVWRDTKEVGCALRDGPAQMVLVCRYSPAGNFNGQKAF